MSITNILFDFLPNFFYSQLFVTPAYPTTDCSGKTIIVTGANTGLGKEAARHFVRLNAAKVIISSRNADKGNAAKRDIEASTKRSGVVEVWPLDLQDYESVKRFAQRARGLERLDIVALNAGINTGKYVEVAGHESTITVNVVSTFLLALLLLPKLREVEKDFGKMPMITITTSELHAIAGFEERKASSIFSELSDEKKASMAGRYPVSKLLEVLVGREWAREHPIEELRVSINFVNPGWCRSDLAREKNGRILTFFEMLLARATEVGSRTLVNAALMGPETHGKYISDGHISSCAPLVEGEEGPLVQKRVWQELSGILNGIEPGVTKAIDAC